MTIEKTALEGRVDQLGLELQGLAARVAQLEALLAADVTLPAAPPLPRPALTEPAPAPQPAQEEYEDVSEEILDWAGKAHLLTRLSTLCFLLVVALGLRTVTDNNLIGTLAGSVLGMGYAAALMLWGAYIYERKSPLAPVFACCGAGLMSVIVVETHTRFAALPLVPAYLTLILTGGWMTVISYRHRAFLPISLGTLGMCLAGAAIDYPHPFFPYLAMVLFAANILGYFAAQLKSCSWLRWIVLVVTIAMLQLWGVRLGQTLLHRGTPTPDLAPSWYIPVLVLFALLYLVLACAGILRSKGQKISRFDFALPTLNVLWSFSAAFYAVNASGGSKFALGAIGLAASAGHLGVTVWLSGRKEQGSPGTNSFAMAGAALAALALPVATGSFILSLPALAVAALFLAILSRQWENGGIRATSYLVQLYAALALAAAVYLDPATVGDLTNSLPAGLLAIIAMYHYRWCRRYPPPSPSLFSRFDSSDRSGSLLLLAALANWFLTLKVILLQGLTLTMPAQEVANALRCGESVLINVSAAGAMLLAYYRRNKEWRNVAILLTIIGGVKVFLYDLLGCHGFPLVASIFTFGVAAALESVALGRWQKRQETGEGGESGKTGEN
ncbi:MAG TPA: hypothetical protein DCZ75_10320 [Geobacter sp.]|nr:hypothetical protein [Geobacter sp.]